jgi:hypothetical protein
VGVIEWQFIARHTQLVSIITKVFEFNSQPYGEAYSIQVYGMHL